MTKEEFKQYVSKMSVEQLRENLFDAIMLMNRMKEALDLRNAELLIEKERRKIEKQEMKKAIQSEMDKQNSRLN